MKVTGKVLLLIVAYSAAALAAAGESAPRAPCGEPKVLVYRGAGDASQCMKDELLADGTCPNKFLIDPNKKTFRAIWLKP